MASTGPSLGASPSTHLPSLQLLSCSKSKPIVAHIDKVYVEIEDRRHHQKDHSKVAAPAPY
jgi:hypothetical protein